MTSFRIASLPTTPSANPLGTSQRKTNQASAITRIYDSAQENRPAASGSCKVSLSFDDWHSLRLRNTTKTAITSDFAELERSFKVMAQPDFYNDSLFYQFIRASIKINHFREGVDCSIQAETWEFVGVKSLNIIIHEAVKNVGLMGNVAESPIYNLFLELVKKMKNPSLFATDNKLDLHGFSHGAGLVALFHFFKIYPRCNALELVTGVGFHGKHNMFAFKSYILENLPLIFPDWKGESDPKNAGVLKLTKLT